MTRSPRFQEDLEEQSVSVLVLPLQEETIVVIMVIPQECVFERIVEHIVDVSVPEMWK